MTVSSSTARVDYDGNGVTVAFPITFRFLANTDLLVLRTVTATGVSTTLILDSLGVDGFSVEGAGQPSGGTVTVVTAPSALETITVLRSVSRTQLTDYIPNDPFPAESHERALDKLTMIVQEQDEVLTRTFSLPAGLPGVSAVLPAPDPLHPLVWNVAGTALENGDILGTGDMLLRPNLASGAPGYGGALVSALQTGTGMALRNLTANNALALNVMDAVLPANDAAILSGAMDASPAISAVIDEAIARGLGGIRFPAGRFLMNSTVTKTLTSMGGFSIEGAGMGITQLIVADASGNGFDFTAQAGDGNWWLSVDPSSAFRIANLSILASGLNVGTGVKISGNSLEGRPGAPITLDHVEIRAKDSINGQAFLTGLWLHDCMSVFATSCRFMVGGTSNLTPTAVKIDATDATTDPVNVYFNHCEWWYGGKGILSGDFPEGIYLTNCSMVKVDKGVEWTATAESGLHVIGGHFNCLSYNFDLNGIFDWTVTGAVCFLSGGAPQAHIRTQNGSGFTVNGCAFTTGPHAINVVSAPSGIRGGTIAGNQFNSFTTAAIALGATANDITVGVNGYTNCTAKVTNANTTYAENKITDSGSYTPTLTNTANIDASVAYVCQYSRNGDVVTVSGRVDIDPTAAALVQLGISLPWPTNLATNGQLGGTASTRTQSAQIIPDLANDRALLEFTATGTTNNGWFFSFTYWVA